MAKPRDTRVYGGASQATGDPSPTADDVEKFHANADTDTRAESIHHTLGPNPTQASPGNHNHRGGDSQLLLSDITLTGSRGGNLALPSIIQALVALGAVDNTSA